MIAHAWGTQLNLATAAHFLASTYMEPGRAEETAPLLEVDRTPNPMRDEMYGESLKITNGTVAIPEKPGLGVTPNLEAMKQYLVQETETNYE